MKIVFIADAHLKGLGDPNQKDLVRFLKELRKIDILVVLGDLFDFWAGSNKVAFSEYAPILECFSSLRKRGTGLIYLEGNHDFRMGRFFSETLGGGVYPDRHEMVIEGKKVLLSHGDTISMTKGYALWRGFLRSPLFTLVLLAAPHEFVWKVAKSLSGKSREYNGTSTEVEDGLVEFAKRRIGDGFDAVVLAHSHTPGISKHEWLGRAGIYANPGSWAGQRSYLVYEDGEFRVERWGKFF